MKNSLRFSAAVLAISLSFTALAALDPGTGTGTVNGHLIEPGTFLAGVSLFDADLQGASLANATLTRANLSKADLSNADLAGADLSQADLSQANLSNANLTGANLQGAILHDANLAGAASANASYESARLRTVDFSGADLSGANFSLAQLDIGNFTNADLSGASFQRGTFARGNASGADLSGADFRGTDVFGSDFSGANLIGLKGAGARDVPLALPTGWNLVDNVGLAGPGCDLSGATFHNPRFPTGQNLRGANLSGARFENAEFENVDFENANLDAAVFSNCRVSGGRMAGISLDSAQIGLLPLDRQKNTLEGLESGGITGTPATLLGVHLVGGHLIGRGTRLASVDIGGWDLSAADLHAIESSGLQGAPSALPEGWVLHAGRLLGPGVDVGGWNLSGANLDGVRSGQITGIPAALPSGWMLEQGWLVGPKANLRLANLSGLPLHGANLSSADLSSANLVGTNLQSANLQGARLAAANLGRAFLESANLAGANATSASFTHARMKNADLSSSHLKSAVLLAADLRNANLANANLEGANFQWADLTAADFSGSAWSNSAQPPSFLFAIHTSATVLPDGIDPAAESMVFQESTADLQAEIDSLDAQLATAESAAAQAEIEHQTRLDAVWTDFANLGSAKLPDALVPRLVNPANLSASLATESVHDRIFLYSATALGDSGYAVDLFDLSDPYATRVLVQPSNQSSPQILDPGPTSLSSRYDPDHRRFASSGSALFLADHLATAGGKGQAGIVRVATANATTGLWEISANLTASSPLASARFGRAMSADSTHLAVSAPGGGPVEIFTLSNGTWIATDSITPPPILTRAASNWGSDLHLAAHRLFVANDTDTSLLGTQGTIAVFHRAESGWNFHQVLKTPTPAVAGTGSRFGHRVLFRDGLLVVSEPGANNGKGLVHLFAEEAGKLRATASLGPNLADATGFGSRLAMADGGSIWTSDRQGRLHRILAGEGTHILAQVDLSGIPNGVAATDDYSFPTALEALRDGSVLAVDFATVTTDSEGNTTDIQPGRLHRFAPGGFDSDSDGLPDERELLLGTNPLLADSTADGISDGTALQLGLNPASSLSALKVHLAANPDLVEGLYSTAQIRDLRPGSTLLEVANGNATLSLHLQESTDLANWTDIERLDIEIPAEAPAKFFRFAR